MSEPGTTVAQENVARRAFAARRDELPNLRRDVNDWPGYVRESDSHGFSSALGWFSIGLGLAEILAPRAVAQASGLNRAERQWLPLMGARELATGIGILASNSRASWLWGRVAGDAVDLALLANALRKPETDHTRATFATAAVAAVTIFDIIQARRSGCASEG